MRLELLLISEVRGQLVLLGPKRRRAAVFPACCTPPRQFLSKLLARVFRRLSTLAARREEGCAQSVHPPAHTPTHPATHPKHTHAALHPAPSPTMSTTSAAAAPVGHLVVQEDDPAHSVVLPCSRASTATPLADGQVLVHVAKLVVTANTVTYALGGKLPVLKYFDHFGVPTGAPPGVRMSPCWGHGVVVASRVPEVPIGTRLHGLFTFSPTVVLSLRPAHGNYAGSLSSSASRAPTLVKDVSAHREHLVDIYKMYFTGADPQWRGASVDREDYQLSTGALFSTGWGMAHAAAVQPSKPTALLLTSASSRTARAAAFAAKFAKLPLRVLGLTSPGNLEFVRGLGLYDEVFVYGDEAALPTHHRTALHDVAGSAAGRERIYRRLGDAIVYSSVVGMAHAGAAGQRASLKGLGGAKPFGFFVVTALEEVGKAYGKRERDSRLRDASTAFDAVEFQSFRVARHFGAAATCDVFERTVRGEVDPTVTQVCSMWPEDMHEPIVGAQPAQASAARTSRL